MAVVTSTTLAARFAARYPHAQPGTVATIAASAGSVPAIDAAAVRGFATVSGKLFWVKANEHFYVSGEPVLAGDFVQVEETDAKRLVNGGRADYATDDEVRAAQTPSKGKA